MAKRDAQPTWNMTREELAHWQQRAEEAKDFVMVPAGVLSDMAGDAIRARTAFEQVRLILDAKRRT